MTWPSRAKRSSVAGRCQAAPGSCSDLTVSFVYVKEPHGSSKGELSAGRGRGGGWGRLEGREAKQYRFYCLFTDFGGRQSVGFAFLFSLLSSGEGKVIRHTVVSVRCHHPRASLTVSRGAEVTVRMSPSPAPPRWPGCHHPAAVVSRNTPETTRNNTENLVDCKSQHMCSN